MDAGNLRMLVDQFAKHLTTLAHTRLTVAGYADAARHFVTLRDGAMSAAYLDTPTTAIRTFARGVDRLIRAIDTFP